MTVPTPSSQRILVVDDELHVRDLVSRWLCGAGYDCLNAGGVVDAWTCLEREPFDLVTLDIRMPDGSGLDLLDRIQQSFPEIAVLMITGEGDTSKAVRALTRGAFGYLSKPIQREELLAQVAIGLDRRRLILENRNYLQGLESMVREQTREIRAAHEETVQRLMTVSMYRDEETGGHIRRTGLYSEQLAAAAGWSQASIDRIRLAAPMHDIGKIAIPDAILRKPGKLTAEEMNVMRTHARLGARMLSGSDSPVLSMAREIALHHHERWDGGGYPFGIAGGKIPESARILSIVDVFDALSHDRVYRHKLSRPEVLEMLQAGRATHFDPRLLDIFLSLLPEMYAIAETIIENDERLDPLWDDEIEFAAMSLASKCSSRIEDATLLPNGAGRWACVGQA
jgi:putative two-component system response regulator